MNWKTSLLLIGAGAVLAGSMKPGFIYAGEKIAAESSGAEEKEPAAAGREAGEDYEAAGPMARRNSLCGTCYEVFVYSFYDSDGDGIGDLNGLTGKLDYINDGDPLSEADLGCDMIWTMPVFPSPTYHKYDVTDYCAIDPAYGTMEDFDRLLSECHRRGVRLILDLPLNHTSSGHPWFTAAAEYLKGLEEAEKPDENACPCVSYYHFSREASDGYAPLSESGWYYEARFWEGMPDLNLDNPKVRENIAEIVDFWLTKGVDGFRLDAVTYYYTGDEEANISFLTWLNEEVKSRNPDAYIVGEAWVNESIYSRYYASGIDSLFNFDFAGAEGLIAPLAGGKKAASKYGERIMEQEELFSSFNPYYIDAPFYTNHDMARGAGYYTRDDGTRVKLAMGLNLLMPGRAFIYYGEELGMKGSGIDENKRAPMYWSSTPGAAGQTSGPPGMEEFEMKFGSLEQQQADPSSIYNYVKQAVHIREQYPAISRGKTRMAEALSGKETCVLVRYGEDLEPVILAFNMSEKDITFDRKTVNEALSDVMEGLGEKKLTLKEKLLTSSVMPVFSARRLTIPAHGIVILGIND